METRRNAGRAPARAGLRAVSVVKVEDKKENEMETGKETGGRKRARSKCCRVLGFVYLLE